MLFQKASLLEEAQKTAALSSLAQRNLKAKNWQFATANSAEGCQNIGDNKSLAAFEQLQTAS